MPTRFLTTKELGVTPEMITTAMDTAKFSMYLDDDKLPALSEFMRFEAASEHHYWKDHRVKNFLTEIRERRFPLDAGAALIGVSRNKLDLKCGGIKTKEEIAAEEDKLKIQKISDREEAAKNRIKYTHLDSQIEMDESNEENLCDYEKQRLANLRERKALMEQLNIMGDKLEIRRLNQVVRVPKEREETPVRQKSARIQRQKEIQRLKDSRKSAATNSPLLLRSGRNDHWFGKNVKCSIADLPKLNQANVVPKMEINAKQLLEATRDLRASSVFLDSISQECEEKTWEASYEE